MLAAGDAWNCYLVSASIRPMGQPLDASCNMVDIGEVTSADVVGVNPSHSGKLVFGWFGYIVCDGLPGTTVGCSTDDKD